jgi:hypothetical protein
MNKVQMTHYSDPASVYTAVPERSFREYWAPKGWISKVPLKDPESLEVEDPQPTNTNTEDDPA